MLPKRFRFVEVAIVLIAFAAMLMPILTYSAQSPAAYMPIVRNGQAAPVVTRLVTLVDTDAGFVAAAPIPNTTRVIVGYIDRRDGNRLKIGEHVGDTIKPLPDPQLRALAARLLFGDVLPTSPSFVYPGPKHGTAAIVFVGQEMRWYATAREEGDETGPFKVRVLISAIPAPQ